MRLLELLAGLSEEDWSRRTAAPQWTVKDIAAHLLQGDIGELSRWRDGFLPGEKPIARYAELVELVNGLNDQWVRAARRISPRLLREFLAFTGAQVEAYYSTLDPLAMGGPVNWAGPDAAPVWFDLARQFTERWHHQQQIRDATGRAPLYAPYYLAPVLDAFVRALPHSFRSTAAADGTVLKIEISGEAGGCWYLTREPEGWELFLDSETTPAAEVVIPQDTAWRLFTKGVDGDQARRLSTIRGDSSLASQVFATISVIG